MEKARPRQATASRRTDKVEVEPGFEKRLADTLKKALNTPPKHMVGKRPKSTKR